MLVVGDKEETDGVVAPRSLEDASMPVMKVEEFSELLRSKNRPLGGESL
jgi:threonyl-tRNA synthetase